MRKQRKWLSLALPIVMLMGVVAVPAQAAYTLADFQPITLKGLYDRYDSVGEFRYGVAFVEVDTDGDGWNDLMGLIDSTGKELVAPIYDAMLSFGFSEDRMAMVGMPNSFESGFINTAGKLVIPCQYSEAHSFSEGLAAVTKESGNTYLRGYIDTNGKTVIPFIYEKADSFSEGLAAVSKESRGSYGYINKQGNMVIHAQYDVAEEFKGGYAVVGMELPEDRWNFKYGIIDTTGNVVVPLTEEDYGEICAKQRGLIANTGKADYVIQAINGVEYVFVNGYAQKGTEVRTPNSLSPGSDWVTYKDLGFINQKGELITSTTYDSVENFSQGFAVVKKEGKAGLIDTSGNEVLPLEYTGVCSFNKSGTATVYAENGDVIILTAPITVASFTDVGQTAYYRDAVKWAVDKKVTSGTSATTFSPDATCSNGQILTFLWRANGQPEPTKANSFTDVKDSDYYYKAALWASEKGLIAGTTLGADTPCTRSMVVTYLWKLAGQPEATKATIFTDVDSNADYAKAVAWAVEQEITSGTSATTFAPDGICTRGQIVTFLFRAMGK